MGPVLVMVVAGSLALGALPVAFGPSATVAALGVGIAGVCLLLIRRVSGPARSPHVVHEPRSDDAPAQLDAESDALRLPRACFYLGALTASIFTLRPAFGLTPSEILFFGAVIGAVLTVVRGASVASLPSLVAVGAGLFALGGAISSVGAHDPISSATETLQGIYVMLIWLWAAMMILRKSEHVRTAVSLFTIGVAVCGLGAIWQTVGFEFLTGPLHGGRASAWAGHVNELGGLTAVALLPALALATESESRRSAASRGLRWLAVGLISAGLLLSGSVGAMLGALMALVLWLSLPSVRGPARIVFAVALLGVVGSAAVGRNAQSPLERIEKVTTVSAGDYERGSGSSRLNAFKAAWERISDNPLVGTGLDANGRGVTVLDKGTAGTGILHGAQVAAWYMAGIFGFLGYMLASWGVAVLGWRGVVGARSGDDRNFGWALTCGFFAFWIWAWTEPLFFTQYGWMAGAMLVAWSVQHPRMRLVAGRAVPSPLHPEPRAT